MNPCSHFVMGGGFSFFRLIFSRKYLLYAHSYLLSHFPMSDTNTRLADLLFPDFPHTAVEWEAEYPARTAPMVNRFGPSPTGFLHIGGIYTTLLNERLVHQAGGLMYLRIEDTDQEREIENGVKMITDGIKTFGIPLDEGPIGENGADVGAYGPYTQSKREMIYKTFARELVLKGLAYPCFLSQEEMDTIREDQSAAKQPPGIYGSYSIWRSASIEEVEEALRAGKPYTIRFRSPGHLTKRVTLTDEIRGKLEMNDSYNDIVILKKTGIPTYHFAHVVDDHLMRTTHVIRAEEWLPSLPLHIQLTEALGWTPPKYVHIAPLLKADGGGKRKLSKRHDPEANVEYFFQEGYPIEALMDYMINIMNSGYEDWRRENPTADYRTFEIRMDKLPLAGALFDLQKLSSISNEFLTRIPTEELISRGLEWARKYDPELAKLMEQYPDLTFRALDIERHTEKDPRRFTRLADLRTQLVSFYDETFAELKKSAPALPECITPEIRSAFVADYLTKYDPSLDRDAWFEQLKDIAHAHGFARSGEEWKTGEYRGRVGDIAMMLRILLCASPKTPDLCLTMQALGREKVEERMRSN